MALNKVKSFTLKTSDSFMQNICVKLEGKVA